MSCPGSTASFNDDDIIDVQCTYSTELLQEAGITNQIGGQANGVSQVFGVQVKVDYSCKIDFTNVAVADVETKWRTVIKPFIVNHSKDVLGLSNYAQAGTNYIITSDKHTFIPATYTLSGNLTFIAPTSESSIVRLSETVRKSIDEGVVHSKIWDGNPNTHARWELGQTTFITRQTTIEKLGSPQAFPPLLGQGFVRLSAEEIITARKTGGGTAFTLAGDTVSVDKFTTSFVELYLVVENAI